jgi:hypothetical protein
MEDRPKGSFLLEYAGELLTADEGNRRKNLVNDYSVYCYFFSETNVDYWQVFYFRAELIDSCVFSLLALSKCELPHEVVFIFALSDFVSDT